MPVFDPALADMRFGCGLSPEIPPPVTLSDMLASLTAPDQAATDFPIERYETYLIRISEFAKLSAEFSRARGTPKAKDALDARKRRRRETANDALGWFGNVLMRRTWSEHPFRERLTGFWADHFTTAGKAAALRSAVSPYVESAIRPLIAGHFEDLLISAVTHPLMVTYLDQDRSFGPNSAFAATTDQTRGLNENLGREILELHTLGVGGPYTQDDVRQLATLLTGVTADRKGRASFRPRLAEPGPEVILGQEYGGDPATLDHVHEALRGLANHPATAQHLCRKLAIHFVSDTPADGLITAMEEAYLDTGGLLLDVYSAMLSHPAAWHAEAGNIKRPVDFIGSSLRALALPPAVITRMRPQNLRGSFQLPMQLMGHRWEMPNGPDGLPEEDSAWLSPQGLAARLQWALTIPGRLIQELPDPRDFVETALGPRATARVRFAADAAETKSDGVGLVLASPAFQRA
ncbi:MAG: DUF1800 domain-containing protein [Rhodobacteraceae bacterium]|nr:DUF1800 domain-containing protein [Paracoccaceae bacterium]